MNRFFSFLSFLFLTSLSFAQKVNYTLSMPHPESHYFHVKMELSGFDSDSILIKMPVWAPGSYLVREFSANVNRVRANDAQNKALPIHKITKNTWFIHANKSETISVFYEVYAFELSVRTSFLDLSHGYVNGTSIFMYVDGYKNHAGILEIQPYHNFKKVSTALPSSTESLASDNSLFFQYTDYDQLVDCPIEIGNQTEFSFEAAGVHHRVAMYGEAEYDSTQIKKDLAKIVSSETKAMGSNPNKDYLFIIHNVESGGGGLEHKNSTTLSVNREIYKKNYNSFLSLVAHEHFHLWNVKRLRPLPLGPFDYDRENYTSLLWFSEGFTSYYADLMLRRTGFYSVDEFTHTVLSGINYVERTIGNSVQPVADASFDAWIKAYRPNENSNNTTISYYSKGRVIGAVWDAMIISHSQGKQGLDNFMQLMYDKYAVQLGRGFTPEELEHELGAFLQHDMHDFFEKYIYDTQTIDYASYFSAIGFGISIKMLNTPYFGANFQEIEGGLYTRSVDSDSPAEKAGLSPGDVVITINDSSATTENWKKISDEKNAGKSLNMNIVRDGLLKSIHTELSKHNSPSYELQVMKKNPYKALFDFWTREDN